MKIEIINQLKKFSSENSKTAISTYTNTLIGGSSSDFETPDDYDPTTDLVNDFDVKEVEVKEFSLGKTNTFSKDILAMLTTVKQDIAFIHVFCYSISDVEKPVPIRFKVKLNGTVSLGFMSSFSMLNMKEVNDLTEILISDIVVAEGQEALLTVAVGSRDQYIS